MLRSGGNYDGERYSLKTGLSCEGSENRTKQEFRNETDINTILKRFNVTGQLPTGVRMPSYGDFSGVQNFMDAANAIALARESFEEMPARVRERFQNDPAKFVDFCSNPDNLEECRKMGLAPPGETVKPPVVAEPPPSGVATAASSPSSSGAAPGVPAAPAASSTNPT